MIKPLCKVTEPEPCERIAEKVGMCEIHYRRFRKYGDPTAGRMIKGMKGKPCTFEGGCTNGIDIHGLCKAHAYRLAKYGDPAAGPPVLEIDEKDGKRVCKVCGIPKPLAEFPPDANSTARGRKLTCLDCRKARYMRYYLRNREKVALARIRKLYGEAGVEVEQRRQAGAGCDVCGRYIKLAIDHCHVSGATRGLLCTPCNTALGSAEDDPSRLRALADYLEKFR
jgi:Autographiviridae endonuclease VII